jgi:hypothetical protein
MNKVTCLRLMGLSLIMLLGTGCEMDMVQYQKDVHALDDMQLERLHTNIRNEVDSLQSPAFFAGASPFSMGNAEAQLRDLRTQRDIVEREMASRGQTIPWKP